MDLDDIVNEGQSRNTLRLSQTVKNKIINSLTDGNRLTIIVGGTGCGKSTLVPKLLLDNFGGPILCTQPRRLAVVAVSSHVAQQRNNSALGDEVGYHVGQNRVVSENTKLLFATAGIFLEELKTHGLSAISKYKAVLIDECHERSSESDLCLVLIKSIMTKYSNASDIRIILMSATFNQNKYTSYFAGVPGCEFINTVNIESAESINALYKQVQTNYLEDIAQKIYTYATQNYEIGLKLSGDLSQLRQFERKMRLDPDSELVGVDTKSLSDSTLMVLTILVMVLNQEEHENARFLIFAPTYRHLEQIYFILSSFSEYRIGVLHSSIDMQDCLESMKDSSENKNAEIGKRHILLASAIADSSVTIPGVSCVIDTCRALEVRWDAHKENYHSKTIWASKSVCDQRRGRTGRTCSGRVFRLIPRSFYINGLENWDQPQIELTSCRDEILALVVASSHQRNKMLANPITVLERCLDPPPSLSMTKAVKYLIDVGACTLETKNRKETIVPTEIGRILSALPFKIEEAYMIVRGAQSGLLHEALVLTSILNTRPYPIVHHFGESEKNELTLRGFYHDVDVKDKKSVAVANFSAYLYWYVNWKLRIWQNPDHCYLPWEWSNEKSEGNNLWCKDHNINPTSVKAIDTEVDVALEILYSREYMPDWLKHQSSSSKWSQHTYTEGNSEVNIFNTIYGYNHAYEMIQALKLLQDPSSSFYCTEVPEEKLACIHFLQGNCIYGSKCRNAHSYTAPRPLCRFFLNGGCTNAGCVYSHSIDKRSNRVNLNLEGAYMM